MLECKEITSLTQTAKGRQLTTKQYVTTTVGNMMHHTNSNKTYNMPDATIGNGRLVCVHCKSRRIPTTCHIIKHFLFCTIQETHHKPKALQKSSASFLSAAQTNGHLPNIGVPCLPKARHATGKLTCTFRFHKA